MSGKKRKENTTLISLKKHVIMIMVSRLNTPQVTTIERVLPEYENLGNLCMASISAALGNGFNIFFCSFKIDSQCSLHSLIKPFPFCSLSRSQVPKNSLIAFFLPETRNAIFLSSLIISYFVILSFIYFHLTLSVLYGLIHSLSNLSNLYLHLKYVPFRRYGKKILLLHDNP